MQESDSDWRLIVGVIAGCAAVLVVAAFVIWVVFYGYLSSFSKGPSTTGTASGRTSSIPWVVGSPAEPVAYAAPSGAYVSLSSPKW